LAEKRIHSSMMGIAAVAADEPRKGTAAGRSREAPACGTVLVMGADTETIASPGLVERERVLGVLREQAPRLRARGIARLSLFGSMARGEAGSESDIDLLIEVDPEAGITFFALHELAVELGALLGRPVQLAFASTMRPWLRAWVEDDRVEVF
jgi:uncharacterized protein